jgi:hydroxyacylglutathione hydrolase
MKTEIHPLSLRMGRNNCYLIKEDGIIMVDAGTPKHGKKLLKWLEGLSIAPGDISLLLLTHGHIDHRGSANEFKKLTGCKVAINYREKDWVEKSLKSLPPGVNLWGKVCAAIGNALLPFINFPGTSVDLALGDEDYSLECYGIHGRVIHTPGHTSGSMSVLLDTGEAFVGDLAVNGLPMRIGPGMPEYAENTKAIKESWRLLLSKGAKQIYPAHGRHFSADVLEKLL